MGQARRQAVAKLSEIQATPGYCQRTAAMMTQVSDKLSANYRELEKAVADRVQLSKEALQQWQDETRTLMRELSQMPNQAIA
jgi:ABC-type transport system involved in Fe-S cluster assembly fused permease/ATPase subunit